MICPHCQKQGFIEIIVGCMFAGKSEELIRRIRLLPYAKLKFQLFKPIADNRDGTSVKSHDNNSLPAITISDPWETFDHLDEDTDVVGFDETQFFPTSIVEVVEKLANMGKRVIIAGLDTTYEGKGFNSIPELMARAESITKVHAHCVKCGAPAFRSHRLTDNTETVQTGAANEYEALCRNCFQKIK